MKFASDIVTASAKGLDERTVLRRHVVRAAAVPVISAAGMTVNITITNVVLIEAVFAIPGVFGHMKNAIAYGEEFHRERKELAQ